MKLHIAGQVSPDLIEKTGAMPARSRRCKDELCCMMSLCPIGMGRRSGAMNPSQKNCLTDNHRQTCE